MSTMLRDVARLKIITQLFFKKYCLQLDKIYALILLYKCGAKINQGYTRLKVATQVITKFFPVVWFHRAMALASSTGFPESRKGMGGVIPRECTQPRGVRRKDGKTGQ